MDATWGVVIVAVVGTMGTVAGVWLQARHQARLASDQRRAEELGAQKAELLGAFSAYMDAIAALDLHSVLDRRPNIDHSESEEEWQRLRSQLDRAEISLSAWGDDRVQAAADRLASDYTTVNATSMGFAAMRSRRDDLTSALRDQIKSMDGPASGSGVKTITT